MEKMEIRVLSLTMEDGTSRRNFPLPETVTFEAGNDIVTPLSKKIGELVREAGIKWAKTAYAIAGIEKGREPGTAYRDIKIQ